MKHELAVERTVPYAPYARMEAGEGRADLKELSLKRSYLVRVGAFAGSGCGLGSFLLAWRRERKGRRRNKNGPPSCGSFQFKAAQTVQGRSMPPERLAG